MGKFTVIPQNTFEALQLDAGVLLKRFNPDNPIAPADEDIICATTGGITVACVPTFSDLGEDVDNVPVNMMELKHLDNWDCSISTSSLGTSPELIHLALGCADIDETDGRKIIPRMDLKQTDFTDIWWVGDKADGGLVAVQLKKALSTGGFSLQTTKNGKGQISITITGHVSLNAQKEVPMVFYSANADEPGPTPVGPSITLDESTLSLVIGNSSTIVATTVPDDAEVTWESDDDEIATVEAGEVTAVAAGEATITASITVEEETYSAECTVTVTSE